jgi:hypothetical protein
MRLNRVLDAVLELFSAQIQLFANIVEEIFAENANRLTFAAP